MTITIDNFRIKSSEGIDLFDLYEIKEVKKGERMGTFDDVGFAWGISLTRCVQIIIQETLKSDDEEMTLSKFIESYETISNNVLEKVKEYFKK